LRGLAVAIVLLAAAGGASAASWRLPHAHPYDCDRQSASGDEYLVPALACFAKLYGRAPVVAAAGDRVLQIFFRSNRYDGLALELRETAAGQGRILLIDRDGNESPIEGRLAQKIVPAMQAELQSYEGDSDAARNRRDPALPEAVVCGFYGRVAIATNITGAVRRYAGSSCDPAWAFWYAEFVARHAVEALPACMAIDSTADVFVRLQYCLRLHPDRALAMQAVTASSQLGNDAQGAPPGAAALTGIVGARTRLQVPGHAAYVGPQAIAAAWAALQKADGVTVYLGDATTEGDAVVLTGTLLFVHETSKDHYEWNDAPFRQLWRRDAKGQIGLVDWRIAQRRFVARE
jgi:hypothetical protein